MPAGRVVQIRVRKQKATGHMALWEGNVPVRANSKRASVSGGGTQQEDSEAAWDRASCRERAEENAGARQRPAQDDFAGRGRAVGPTECGACEGDLRQESHWLCFTWEGSSPEGVWRGPWEPSGSRERG